MTIPELLVDDDSIADAVASVDDAVSMPISTEGYVGRNELIRRLASGGILSADDAAEQAKVYQRGLAAAKLLNSGKQLTTEQMVKAKQRRRDGDAASTLLVGSMVKLSMQIVREFSLSRRGYAGADPIMDDLLTEANIAVLEAAGSFDSARGPAFNTWAAQAVRNRIRTLVMDQSDSGVKVASSWSRMRRRARMERSDMAEELGRAPTLDELRARLLHVCEQWAIDHLTPAQKALPLAKQKELATAKLRKQGMLSALEHLDDVMVSGASTHSLQVPVSGGDGAALGDLLQGHSHMDEVHDRLQNEQLSKVLSSALADLSERERSIILHRFGFVDGEVWTYQAIGNLFNISAERVRQIEERVRTQMKSDPMLGPVLWSHLHPDN